MTEEQHQEFWRNNHQGFVVPAPLVIDKLQTSESALDGKSEQQSCSWPSVTTNAIQAFVESSGISLETLVLGAWSYVLSRYSGELNVLLGWATAVRQKTSLLPLPIRIPAENSALSWLQQLHSHAHQCRRYGEQPLRSICEDSGLSLAEPPFSSVVAVDCSVQELLNVLPHQVRSNGDVAAAAAKDALVLTVRSGDPTMVEINFDRNRFESQSIARMLQHFRTVIDAIVTNAQTRLQDLPLLSETEKHQILVEWNNTQFEFPHDQCLHQLFEARASQQPNSIALVFQQQQITYGELNVRANQLAHHLRALKVGPNVLVGVFVQRSVEMVVGLLAIHKAGGAYVPLDPAYPAERLAFMLQDTNVPVLLTQQALVGQLPEHSAKVFLLDTDWKKVSNESTINPDSGVTPENLAYVIYTSGSTGTPKAAVLNHRGRVSNFFDFNSRYSIGPGDRLLALSSLSFDMSAYDTFGTLAAGATMVVPPPSSTPMPGLWAHLMVEQEITVWHSVPALLDMMVDHVADRPALWPSALKLVLLGGDWIPLSLPDRIKAIAHPDCRTISMGGATEVSMDSTIFEIHSIDPSWKSIPYGAPMYNQLAYVLDRQGRPQPVGVPGELYLGGIGVGEGYLNRPELTAERFVRNPFRPNERMYKTGDLVKWREDGNLELLGRMDFQVKIRGFRVELGEIEATLRKHPAVRECVVLARQGKYGEKRLVAYVVQNAAYVSEAKNDHERQAQQVADWQRVYDHAYSANPKPLDPTFNIVSWDSSYTCQPIPADEMRVWVDSTVERILSLKPKRVLEIGCGLGLLLFRIAPTCDVYLGTDISPIALDFVSREVDVRQLPQVKLKQLPAHDFTGIEEGFYDAVVLNSIILDFPGTDYLMRVLEGAVGTLVPGGKIFVGDVRNFSLLEIFQTSVQMYRVPASATVEQLRQRIRKRLEQEGELTVDPHFFISLQKQIPEIQHVEIQSKRGDFHNELNKFRYDVTLYRDPISQVAQVDEWLDWQSGNWSLEKVKEVLSSGKPQQLAFQEVPNARLLADLEKVTVLRQSDPTALVGELRGAILDAEVAGVDPEAIFVLAEQRGYHVNVRYAQSGDPAFFDVILLRAEQTSERLLFPSYAVEADGSLGDYANDPLTAGVRRTLVPQLRKYMDEKMPDYMVPSAFVLLDTFPLSPNGKINRRALPEPSHERPELDVEFVLPRTPLEQVVASIWADVLSLDEVGIEDGFIRLGGSSLLAVEAAARLQDVFQLELPLTDIYRCNVAQLGQKICDYGRSAGLDVNAIASAWHEVQNLSDTEIQSLLTNENSAR